MFLTDGIELTEKLTAHLAPYCEQITVAGAARRSIRYFDNLDVVCQPKKIMQVTGLFGETELTRVSKFSETLRKISNVITGYPELSQSLIIEYCGKQINLFCADTDNFGVLLALKTGSENYINKVVKTQLERCGYRITNEFRLLRLRDKIIIPVSSEFKFYELINLTWVTPQYRNL